jgi:hypothetical protein
MKKSATRRRKRNSAQKLNSAGPRKADAAPPNLINMVYRNDAKHTYIHCSNRLCKQEVTSEVAISTTSWCNFETKNDKIRKRQISGINCDTSGHLLKHWTFRKKMMTMRKILEILSIEMERRLQMHFQISLLSPELACGWLLLLQTEVQYIPFWNCV